MVREEWEREKRFDYGKPEEQIDFTGKTIIGGKKNRVVTATTRCLC